MRAVLNARFGVRRSSSVAERRRERYPDAPVPDMPNAERILLVEDHADTSAAVFHILTDRGYSVTVVDNGQQALDLLDHGLRARVIIVDLMLPHVSGPQLLGYLQSDPELRLTPTIVITGMPREQVKVVADVVLSKPLDFLQLAATVDELVARHQARA